MAAHRWIDDDAALAAVVEELAGQEAYAVDTEFHRERTYFPQLALVQVAWSDEVALIDPVAVELKAFAEVLDGPGLAVMHAADQDIEVLGLACGTVPSRLFDTQVAAGFLGHSTPSLAALHERLLGIRLTKGDRLTNWLARPLGEDQLRYAAADVDHLLELHHTLVAELESEGRLAWALDESERRRSRAREPRRPEDAWRRIKEARQLRGRAGGVARSVAAWRERRAAEVDQPVRFVLPGLALVGGAQRAPRTVDELGKVRGLDGRHLRGGAGRQILEAVEVGRAAPPPSPESLPPPEIDRALRPAIGLVSAWVSQLARDLRFDATLLATRADIEALLRDEPDARLAQGWRAELVGEPIRQLVAGDAAVAFDGNGVLSLEARSHQAL